MMNKMKKLGLLVVGVCASLAIGVGSANALVIDGTTITTTAISTADYDVTVDGSKIYTVTFKTASFAGNITAETGDTVTIIGGNTTFTGTITATGTVAIVSGDFTGATLGAGTYSITGGTYGTSVTGKISTATTADGRAAKYAQTANADGTYTVGLKSLDGVLVTNLQTAYDTQETWLTTNATDVADGKYTEASLTALNELMAEAEEYLNNSAAYTSEYDGTVADLTTALTAATPVARANYDAFDAAVEDLNEVETEKLGKDFLDQVVAAGEDAENLNKDMEATDPNVGDIATVTTTVTNAVTAANTSADYSKYNALVQSVDANREAYTNESLDIFDMLASGLAQNLTKGRTNQATINARVVAMNNALALAPVAPVEPEKPADTEEPNKGTGTVISTNTVKPNSSVVANPNTADNATSYAVMNVMSLLALAVCGLYLKKHN